MEEFFYFSGDMNVNLPFWCPEAPQRSMLKNTAIGAVVTDWSHEGRGLSFRIKQVEQTEWNYVAVPFHPVSLHLQSIRLNFSSATSDRVLKISSRDAETLS